MLNFLRGLVGVVVGLFVGFGALGLAFAYDVFTTGLVLHTMWGWFVAGTFHVAALPIVVAAGIAMMIHYLVIQLRGPEEKCGVKPEVTANQALKHLGIVLARPWLVLLFGFVLHLFL